MSQFAAQPSAAVMPDELLYGSEGAIATITLNARRAYPCQRGSRRPGGNPKGGPWYLPRLLGRAKAAELIFKSVRGLSS